MLRVTVLNQSYIRDYEYDGLNHRISRTGTDGSKTEYAYGRKGAVIVECAGGITRSYIYANGVIAGFVDSEELLLKPVTA